MTDALTDDDMTIDRDEFEDLRTAQGFGLLVAQRISKKRAIARLLQRSQTVEDLKRVLLWERTE